MPSDPFLFLAFCALQLVDYELTAGILQRGGRELNPIVRRLIARLGNAGLILAKLVALALGAVLLLHGETTMLVAGCVLYVALLAWNWRIHKRA